MNDIPFEVMRVLGNMNTDSSVEEIRMVLITRLNIRGKDAKKYAKMWKRLQEDLKESGMLK